MANKIDWAFMTQDQLVSQFKARRGEFEKAKQEQKKVEKVSKTLKATKGLTEELRKPQSPIKAFLEQLLSKKP